MRMSNARRDLAVVMRREKGARFTEMAPALGVSDQRAHQIFARHSSLTEDLQKDGLKGHGLDTRSAHVLYRILSSRTLECLRQWVRDTPDWKDRVCLTPTGSRGIADRIGAFLRKMDSPTGIGRLYDGLSIRAMNCMRAVCPGFGRMSEAELAAWFAENPLWLPRLRQCGSFGAKTEKEMLAFVVKHRLALPSSAPSMEVYYALKNVFYCSTGPAKDLTRTGMKQWFEDHPDWRETLYIEYSYRRPAVLRGVERYISSEGLSPLPAVPEQDELDRRVIAMHEKGVKYRTVARIYGITPAYWRTLLEKHAAAEHHI